MQFGKAKALFLAIALLAAGEARAHHSFAMFDSTREAVLTGTVVGFQWTNPHVWIELDVLDAEGRSLHWSIEAGSPSLLARQGWSRTSLKPGDKVTLAARPLKDGRSGGGLIGIVLADGTRLGAPIGERERAR